jgi:hypothetical protein
MNGNGLLFMTGFKKSGEYGFVLGSELQTGCLMKRLVFIS